MNKKEILEALDEGSIPCTRMFTGTGENDWVYVKIDVDDLKKSLDEYPWNKKFPCYLSPYKSTIWFEIGE